MTLTKLVQKSNFYHKIEDKFTHVLAVYEYKTYFVMFDIAARCFRLIIILWETNSKRVVNRMLHKIKINFKK